LFCYDRFTNEYHANGCLCCCIFRKLVANSTASETADYLDAFADASHVKESFPDAKVEMELADGVRELTVGSSSDGGLPGPPYLLTFSTGTVEVSNPDPAPTSAQKSKGKRKASAQPEAAGSSSSQPQTTEIVRVKPYKPVTFGPFLEKSSTTNNSVRFTPAQVEAIRSGVNPVSPVRNKFYSFIGLLRVRLLCRD
jgi:hypothetical protein